jgi:hypothetical protein
MVVGVRMVLNARDAGLPFAVAAAASSSPSPLDSCRHRRHRRRRSHEARATNDRQQQQQQQDEEEEIAALEQAVERAASALDEMLQQVLQECVAEQAASFIRRAPEDGDGGGGGNETENAADDDDSDSGSSGWPSADTLEGIVRGAVAQRVEWLDDAFLAALDAYAQAIDGRMRSSSSKSGGGGKGGGSNTNGGSKTATANAASAASREMDARLVEVLHRIRREVLAQVGARLPATVQVLDAALRETEAGPRLAVVSRALGGGGGGPPGISFEALASTAGQLVDDMEDAEAVADRALLARLVLLREELRAMHARRSYFPSAGGEGGGGGGAGAGGGSGNGGGGAAVFGFHRSNLPRACAAFAKELLAVGDGSRRAALLAKAFEEDWTGGAGSNNKGGGGAGGGSGSGGGGGGGAEGRGQKQRQQQTKKEAPDVVRPGRFLATVHAMSDELEARLRREQQGGGGGGGGSDGAGGGGGVLSPEAETAAAVLRRLDEVRMEAVAVLDRMQRAGRASSR